MPSAALLHWQTDRMPRLDAVELQCAASLTAAPANPLLVDENLRGCVVLLSAHSQGFCRDLHTEAAQTITTRVRPRLQPIIQFQFTAHRTLDRGNPSAEHIAADFNRFGINLNLTRDPANLPRLRHLSELNKWRNVAAHQGTATPAGVALNLPAFRAWRASCGGLAASLDAIMHSELRRILRRAPW